jgi:glycosyltransferase involved in cell wall biosynthesis
MKKNIGFISFRLSGTDGVSLETKKWAEVFTRNGCTCHYYGGELDAPPEVSFTVPEAHFQHADIRELYETCFSRSTRPPQLTANLHKFREILKKSLYEFVDKFSIDLLIPENALTIPLNIPLGMAITEFVAETGMFTIAHHHDFFWERKRFLHNCVWDYLNQCYPPHLNSIQHVVINTSARNQLALRTGITSTLIPNVMEFEKPPPGIDEYNSDVRSALEIEEDELLVLQPTRVVQRKGIEHAIELVARMEVPATLVISHASGDEGYEYQTRVKEYAEMLGIKARFVDDIINDYRRMLPDGRKVYSLHDVYPHADLVTYPSLIEGFGNAFLEAIYFRKPILINNYSIYSHDIKPLGFDVIEMDDFISRKTISETKSLLADEERIRRMVEHNYSLALHYFGYKTLETKLWYLVKGFWGESTEPTGSLES